MKILEFVVKCMLIFFGVKFPENNQTASSKMFIKRSLNAQVIRACKCGALGVDENNKYVGETCPKCNSPRPPIEDLGQIWSKSY